MKVPKNLKGSTGLLRPRLGKFVYVVSSVVVHWRVGISGAFT